MTISDQITELNRSGLSKVKTAKALGLTVDALNHLIQSHGIKWVPRIGLGTVIIDGIKDSLDAHAERLGISVGCLRWRLQNHKDLKDPVAIVPVTEDEAKRFTQLRREGYSHQQAADVVGRPYNTLRRAAIKYCPDYHLVVEQAAKVSNASRSRKMLLKAS
jgi:hypothetical protein